MLFDDIPRDAIFTTLPVPSNLEDLLKEEQRLKGELDTLYASGQLVHTAFFACALTPRGRQRIDKILSGLPLQPAPVQPDPENKESGILEIDQYTRLLHAIFKTEGDNEQPLKTLSVFKSAYPQLYKLVVHSGPVCYAISTYTRQRTMNEDPKISCAHSEHFYAYSVIYWLCSILDKKVGLGDMVIAPSLSRKYKLIGRMADPAHKESLELSRRKDAGKPAALSGEWVPCVQMLHQEAFDTDDLTPYYKLYLMAGADLDIMKLFEGATLNKWEMTNISEMALADKVHMKHYLFPYLSIKQALYNQRYLEAALDMAHARIAELKDAVPAAVPVEETVVSLQTRTGELEADNARLAREVSEGRKREKGLKAELARMDKEIRKKDAEIAAGKPDKRELAELRETLYHVLNQKDTDLQAEPEETPDIKFPFTDLPDGILIFGGYDQWRNRMQENFPTVRFVPADYRYDTSIIRNASCIWVHSGYISHPTYYRILTDARAAGVEVHFFRSHSVISSAKLFVSVMAK